MSRFFNTEDRRIAAAALSALIPKLKKLRKKQFEEIDTGRASKLVVDLVADIKHRGVSKNHYAFASKLLHWLLPQVIPIYDQHVRQSLGICFEGPRAYQLIAAWEYRCAKRLKRHGDSIAGSVGPKTLLRAIDKYLMLWAKKKIPQ
jgi:hypothetical protein